MSDGIPELQRSTQSLSRAYNAWQGSFFCKVFAAQDQLQLDPEQRQMRTALLRMMGELVETEFIRAMDELVVHWIAYREATK